jgi:hypothetical protein
MFHKRIMLLIVLCSTAMISPMIACARTPAQPAATTTAQPEDTAAPIPTATVQPEDTARPIPTTTSTTAPISTVTATDTPVYPPAAQHVSIGGIEFMIDPLLQPIVEVHGKNMGEVPYVHFAFSSESALCRESGCIEIYPVDDYMAAYGQVYFPPQGPGGGAAALLKAAEKILEFQNGAGTRVIEMHGQMGYYANNGNLMYIFRGYTHDGKYAAFVQVPLDATILLSSADPQHNTNPDAVPVPDGSSEVDYNTEVARQLDLLPADAFTPNLDKLDALVTSLRIDALPYVESVITLEPLQPLE